MDFKAEVLAALGPHVGDRDEFFDEFFVELQRTIAMDLSKDCTIALIIPDDIMGLFVDSYSKILKAKQFAETKTNMWNAYLWLGRSLSLQAWCLIAIRFPDISKNISSDRSLFLDPFNGVLMTRTMAASSQETAATDLMEILSAIGIKPKAQA